jgi:membrane protease YdiL (CAAX protease family)
MAFSAFRGMKPFPQLLFTAFIALSVFLMFQLVTAVIAIPVFGFQQVMELLDGVNMSDPKTINMLKFFQVSQSVSLFIFPSLLVSWLLFENAGDALYLNHPVKWFPAILVILLVFMVNPFVNFLGGINNEFHLPEFLKGLETWMRNAEETAGNLTESFLKVESVGGLIFNLFMVAVLPSLGEELLFRGVIQKILTDMTRNHHWGIWISAALFSALHMQFFGFIPRMLLGAMFGYLLVWSGSLWLPILAHFVNNATAVLTLWLIDKGVISSAIEEFGVGWEYWYYALPSLVIGMIILTVIRRQFRDVVPDRIV